MPFQYIPYPNQLPYYRCIQESECIKTLIAKYDETIIAYKEEEEENRQKEEFCKKNAQGIFKGADFTFITMGVNSEKSFFQWWREKKTEEKEWKEAKASMLREKKLQQEFLDKLPLTFTIEEYKSYDFPRGLNCSIPAKVLPTISSVTYTRISQGIRMTFTEKEELKNAHKDFKESLPKTFDPKEFRKIMKEMAWKVVIKNGTDKVFVEQTKEGFTCLLKDKEDKTLFTYKFRGV